MATTKLTNKLRRTSYSVMFLASYGDGISHHSCGQ